MSTRAGTPADSHTLARTPPPLRASPRRLSLGRVKVSPAALAALEANEEPAERYVVKHSRLDWSGLPPA